MRYQRFAMVLMAACLLLGCEQPKRTDIRVYAFGSATCGPCRAAKPTLDQIGRYVEVVSVDVDAEQSMADAYHVDRLPTYIVFKHGRQAWRCNDVSELATALGLQ